MAIVLRADTGSALSHNQVDTNFTSFFYSASLAGGTLTFFRTGSTVLGVTNTSSSYSLVSDGFWTGSAGNISRLSTVTVSGSFINGALCTVPGIFAHAQGLGTQAGGNYSHAEGYLTQATSLYSHAEGNGTTAIATGSHAEGFQTQARGIYSHAEGDRAIASGSYSHAEGQQTEAIGNYSHAEGGRTFAIGNYSHAEGLSTEARGEYSHTEGNSTVASGSYQHVQGQYNISSSAQSAFIIGNGTSDSTRSNLVFASGSTFQVTGSLNVTGSFSLRNGAQGAGFILTSDANGASTWSPSFAIESIVTTTSITTETTGSAGLSQRGRCVIIDNGANNINLTVNGSAGFTSTYIKHGSGSVSFVQGSGRTLIPVDGTLVLNGTSGSTATVISYSTSDYLRVNNA